MNVQVDKTVLDYLGVQFLTSDEDNDLAEGLSNPGEAEQNNEDQVDDIPDLFTDGRSSSCKSYSIKCTICFVEFTKKCNLHRHMKKHDGKMKNCNECSKLFFSGYYLARHFNSVHKNITYDCTTCSKTFKSKVGLTYHERGHANNFRFLCPYCSKGFNYKGNFEGHKAGHDGEKNFECSKC
ncbi:KRAB [Mytilus coruscus]|uniref:KRAB n=1 Tax=Mytilus coruscus TaxID=42192 RepID=A0A6J8BR57_MYTCO|nr:KRAB [Mytilus coruscus]